LRRVGIGPDQGLRVRLLGSPIPAEVDAAEHTAQEQTDRGDPNTDPDPVPIHGASLRRGK
jgi:hypothetical protein